MSSKKTKPVSPSASAKLQSATFAAGCFWGVEEEFRKVPGVLKTRVGYTGGSVKNPTYEMVCSDETGHAEAIEMEFDPKKVTFDQLLDLFWNLHDPTQVNRQGPDVGDQYRSAIFYHDEKQHKAAEKSKKKEQEKLDKPTALFGARRVIATQIAPAGTFYPAEEYHQRYFEKRGGGTCHV